MDPESCVVEQEWKTSGDEVNSRSANEPLMHQSNHECMFYGKTVWKHLQYE